MQIHKVRGEDLNDALERARRTYGEGAMVLSHEEAPGGGITLAVAEDPVAARGGAPAVVQGGTLQPGRVEPMNFPAETGMPPGFEEVEARLVRTGCSADWARRLCLRAAEGCDAGDHPMDTIGTAVASEVRIAKLPKAPGVTRVICFVGNTGVGKTTGLVKLGARLVKSRRAVSLATLDSRRVGAVEQLQTYAGLLGTSARVLKGDQELSPQTLGVQGNDVVLLDTTGRAETDAQRLVRLHHSLTDGHRMTRLDAFLVLSATSSRAALREVSEAYGDLPLAGCILTKLDETRSPAGAIEHAVELGLPIAFLSDGQDIGRNLHRASPELLADLLLLGRLG